MVTALPVLNLPLIMSTKFILSLSKDLWGTEPGLQVRWASRFFHSSLHFAADRSHGCRNCYRCL